MVSVQSVHCKKNQNKILICIQFWKPTWNVWKILISKKKTGGPTFSGYSRWFFGSTWPAFVVWFHCPPRPTCHQLVCSLKTVFGVLRPGRTDCNYTWTTCALHQDCLHWNDPGFLWPTGWLYHEVFHSCCLSKWRVYCRGWRNTTGFSMSPRSRIAITTQRKVERHSNNCEARDASQFVEVCIGL